MSVPDVWPPKNWPTGYAPREAYYNGAQGAAIDDYNEIRKHDKDSNIISWVTKFVKLWDVLMSNDGINLPRMPPPPLFIDRSDDTPYVIEPNGDKTLIVGHMAESWANTVDDAGIEIASRSFCQLRLYEKVVKKEIELVAGKTPTFCAFNAVIDRLLFHEMSHYIRNTTAWIRCYDDSPGTYDESYKRLMGYIDNMGTANDEMETEALALCLLRNYYFPCMDRKFILTAESPWIPYYVKRHPEYRDYELVHRYYVCRWKLNYGNHTKAEQDALWREFDNIIAKLHKHGKKNGHKYYLVQ